MDERLLFLFLFIALSVMTTVYGQNVPTVTIQNPSYSVNVGSSVTLVCSVTANPSLTNVFWRKILNGVTTDINVANSNNKYSGSSVSNPSLTINNAALSDEANYVCFAANSIGTGQSAQTFLDVLGGVPTVTILSNSYAVLQGGTITLQCIVSATPTHTSVSWLRIVNGLQTTVTIDGSRLTGGTVSTPSLTIRNAAASDEGIYICTSANSVGTGSSQTTFLDVTGSVPVVTVAQSQYTGDYGYTVTLSCTVTANPAATNVYWRKIQGEQTTDVSTNSSRFSGSTVSSPSLTIYSLVLSDEAFYQCFAQNSVGTGFSQQSFLEVLGGLPSVWVLSSTYTTTFGSTVVLGCAFTANPVVTMVFWQKRFNEFFGVIDIFNNKYSGSTLSTPSLTITGATADDEGNYVCFAVNSVGMGSSSDTFLDVVGNIPSVSIPRSSYSVNIRNQITIPCTVTANPTETSIYWTVTIGSNSPQTISMSNLQKYQGSTVGSPSLIILNTASSDAGEYRCYATNSVGTGNSNPTTLSVVGNVPTVTVVSSNYHVNYGQTVQLVCSVNASPTHTTVYWTKVQNGQENTISMANTAKYSGSTVSNPSLTINNVEQCDETFYKCYATNSVGTGSSQQTFVDVLAGFL